MLRYAFGWVDEKGQSYDTPTGKRIRPLLLMLCTEASGGEWRDALPAAAAVEILHNFSLIHDDIQDNSPIRHNRPTVWKVWGEANAINAGDALFTLAHYSLHQLSLSEILPQQLLNIWDIFNHTSLELTRGQHLDMRFEREERVAPENYISMITGKSAALIAACAKIGSLIGNNNELIANHFYDFGLNIGIAFQIHDDVLGIWGDAVEIGKSTATDILSQKKSLPVLYGLEHSSDLRLLYVQQEFSENDVKSVVSHLNHVNAQEYAIEQEKMYYAKAIDALGLTNLPPQIHEKLSLLLDGLFHRTN
ncbi:MAG: polyprenyl synthetase family protein [Anaerolineae bacterium]